MSADLMFEKNDDEGGILLCGDKDCKYTDGCRGFDK